MRNRFFVIILSSLILAAVGINLVHIYFFKNQRLMLIDKQIAEVSHALLNSEEFKASVGNNVSMEAVLTKVLQGARIGKVFVLRSADNKVIYQNFSMSLLNRELPVDSEWVTLETEEEFVRIKNVKLPGDSHIVLQVGLVLNQNFLNWEIVDGRVIAYVTCIIIALFVISVFMTLLLLSPQRLLIAHLNEATAHLTNMKDVQALPKKLIRYSKDYWAKADEFSGLLNTVQKLIDRINLNYKLTRSWTSQMAHELKTPLAIIRLETEAKRKANLITGTYAADVLKEVEQMSEIISQFLDWAELESSQMHPKDLHALKMKSVVKNTTERLEKMGPKRIELQLFSDFSVLANPIHLEQLIANLVTNALKFSATTEKVEVVLVDNALIVKDYGRGVPVAVLERLGQPFNVGSEDKKLTGNGLGLAWVSAVTKLYQWGLEVRSDDLGTAITIKFPQEEIGS